MVSLFSVLFDRERYCDLSSRVAPANQQTAYDQGRRTDTTKPTKPKKTLNCGTATSDDFSRDYVAAKVSLQSILRGGRYMFAVCRQVTAVAYIIGLLPSRSLQTLENLHLIHWL